MSKRTRTARRYFWAISTLVAIWSGSLNLLRILFAPRHSIINELVLCLTPTGVALPIWRAARIDSASPNAPLLRWKHRRSILVGFIGGLVAVASATAGVAFLAASQGQDFGRFLLLVTVSAAVVVMLSVAFKRQLTNPD